MGATSEVLRAAAKLGTLWILTSASIKSSLYGGDSKN